MPANELSGSRELGNKFESKLIFRLRFYSTSILVLYYPEVLVLQTTKEYKINKRIIARKEICPCN